MGRLILDLFSLTFHHITGSESLLLFFVVFAFALAFAFVSRTQWTAHQPKLQKVLSLKLGQATLGLCQDDSIQIWHIKHVELCACSISCSVGIYFILQGYEKSLLYGSYVLNPLAQTIPTGSTGRHNP